MDQSQILDPSFYVATSTASANVIPTGPSPYDSYQPQQHQPQQHQPQQTFNFSEQQQQVQYPSIDFFYETPHIQPTPSSSITYTTTSNTANTINTIVPTASTSYQTPMTKKPLDNSTATTTAVDEDYVQNLANELQHTKQLLSQYQLRTEQLMELVKKQTDKISELREQLANKN
ncbi:hypothetical protein [Parasitella parasitica]|uniref:Uncharacterized protein n=1 Tax=Parasitella parasitica TaxID=35722 RepID=A0A0B7NBH0_9FUNG|nr:hypothetical protein [Parasitella parasitica]